MNNRVGLSIVLLMLGFVGCRGGGGDAPRVDLGTAMCDACRMTLTDARFVAVVEDGKSERAYDSIECLVRVWRASGETVSDEIWLSDFDTQTLRRQSELTLVHADFPSPMGGGYAAFADRERARTEASSRNGELGTLEATIQNRLERGNP